MNQATIKNVRYFVEVASERSFVKAASKLSTAPSSVKLAVQQLEQSVRLKLLDRTSRGVVLTQAGRDFLPTATRLVRDFDWSISDLKAKAVGERGRLSIVTSISVGTYLLAPAVLAFSKRYPNITLNISNGIPEDAQRGVLSGDVDVAFVARSGNSDDLTFQPVLHDQLCMVCRQGHPLSVDQGPLPWKSLTPFPYLGLTDTSTTAPLQTLRIREKIKALPHEVLTANVLPTLLRGSDAFSILGALTARLPHLADLCARPLNQPIMERTTYAVLRSGYEPTPACKLFLRYVEAQRRNGVFPQGVRR